MTQFRFVLSVALAIALYAAPLAGEAQQTKPPRIGVLVAANWELPMTLFGQGLRELGYVDGQNLLIEFRSAEGKPDTLPSLAAELVRLKVDIIVAFQTPSVQAAKQATNTIPIVMARGAEGFDAAFAEWDKARVDAVVVQPSLPRKHAIDLAIKYRLPAVSSSRPFAESGGLMSYAANPREMYRNAAAYVDKILKGAKPGDLPVQQSTVFELVINGKTAKALGITIPQSVLLRADEVIQ